MFRFWKGFLLPIFVAVVAIFYARSTTSKGEALPPRLWPGRNNTVLFVSDSHAGCVNVLLATSHALLAEYSDIEIHFASFPKMATTVDTISRAVAERHPERRPIIFHEFKGKARIHNSDQLMQVAGFFGMSKMFENMMGIMIPWTVDEYFDLYQETLDILTDVDPVIVAIDPLFGPGVDAVDAQGRNRAIISPNTLKDSFGLMQPWGSGLWKYPAMGTGYTFPVPWHWIPANVITHIRWVYNVAIKMSWQPKIKELESRGIASPFNLPNIYHSKFTHISAGSLAADFPLSILPPYVVPCGPIILSTRPASQQDPDLSAWLKRAPTILINLGSIFTYTEKDAVEMTSALAKFLSTNNLQVLWKFKKRTGYTDAFLSPLLDLIREDKIRMTEWLGAEPAALLETGDIAVFMSHGGASSYHEGVGTGTPQIILSTWGDTYDFAVRVEHLGIGVWANEESAPNWTAGELTSALSKVLGEGEDSERTRHKAKELGAISFLKPGRMTAAKVVAGLARRKS